MEAEALVDSEIAEATRWVSSLDRTPLGHFAVDSRLLVLSRVDDKILTKGYSAENTMLNITALMFEAIFEDIGQGKNKRGVIYDTDAEVRVWYEIQGVDKWHLGVTSRVKERTEFLRSVLDITTTFPEALPYVEAGVMDTDFIRQCIADDIDPELASATLSTE